MMNTRKITNITIEIQTPIIGTVLLWKQTEETLILTSKTDGHKMQYNH